MSWVIVLGAFIWVSVPARAWGPLVFQPNECNAAEGRCYRSAASPRSLMETPLVSQPGGRLNRLSQIFNNLEDSHPGAFMKLQLSAAALALAAFALPAQAQTQIQWWH